MPPREEPVQLAFLERAKKATRCQRILGYVVEMLVEGPKEQLAFTQNDRGLSWLVREERESCRRGQK